MSQKRSPNDNSPQIQTFDQRYICLDNFRCLFHAQYNCKLLDSNKQIVLVYPNYFCYYYFEMDFFSVQSPVDSADIFNAYVS